MARAGGAASPAERGRVASVLKEEYRRLALDSTRPPAAPFVTLGAIPDALSRTPVIADAATAGAFAFFGANMYGLGAAALTRVAPLAEQADSPLAHFARGQRLERENQVAEARAAYETALTGALVGRSALLVGIARLAQVEGDLPSAINAFTEAVRLNPNDPGIHKELSGVYAAAGSTDQAFGELLAALLVNPRDTEAHAAIGQLYLDTSRQAEAVPAFTRALELAPDRYEIRYALARALARTGNQAEAERQLDLFERARRAALDQRRRDIAHEVEQEQRQR
jgi:tetratricopeptide (TPR) repeat protein